MNEDPVHMVVKHEEPRKPGQAIPPVVYASLCGKQGSAWTDFQAQVTCPDCLKMLGVTR